MFSKFFQVLIVVILLTCLIGLTMKVEAQQEWELSLEPPIVRVDNNDNNEREKLRKTVKLPPKAKQPKER